MPVNHTIWGDKMAQFKLTMDLDNDVFQIDTYSEVARIMEVVAERVKEGHDDDLLYDINGNVVGSWEITG